MLPPELEIKKDFFKLNCIPAVNKFYYQAEPIVYQSSRYDYRLIPDRNYPESVVLQSIEDVSAEYKWDYLKSKLIIVDKNIENTAVISCGITVSNGFYPGQYIREGMIGELVNRNNLIKLKNITRPTACLLSPSHKNYFWELINLLNLNSRRLEFNKILKLFDWTDKNSVKKQIESILAVEHKAIHKITRGAFYHGREFTLIIKAEGFKATAEIYLFGCVLHQYLKLTSGQNVFIKLDVEVYPSSRILSWE
jgi:type VI protein secretion system component VasA